MLCRHNQLVMYLSEYIPFFKQHMVVCVYSILTWKATVDTQKIINWYFTSCALIANTQIRKEMIFLGVYFLEWGSPLSAFKDKLCTNAKRGLSGLLALSPASSLFWIYSPVQVTLLPYACFLNLSHWTSTDRSTGGLYSLQMAQQCYRYISPRVPAHVLGLLRSIHVPASLWYYLQGSIIKNFNRAIALKVWVSSECEGLASMQGGYASLGSMPLVQTISIIFQFALNV